MSFDLLNHLTPIASRGGGALGIGEEVAVRCEPAQRLLVGAELDSQRHVGAPHQPIGADIRWLALATSMPGSMSIVPRTTPFDCPSMKKDTSGLERPIASLPGVASETWRASRGIGFLSQATSPFPASR